VPSYLFLRAVNYTGRNAIGQDLKIAGTPSVSGLYGDPFRSNTVVSSTDRLTRFRAANAGQQLRPDDSADTGEQVDNDGIRVLEVDWIDSASAPTPLAFNLTARMMAGPSLPPRTTVTVVWALRNDGAVPIVFHDLYFLCFERAGAPTDELKRILRAFLRHQDDPINFPINLATTSTSGSVTLDPYTGTLTLGASSEVQFRASFQLEHARQYAYPVVSARVGRSLTPDKEQVAFIQMHG
jgi:hypothetical protein